MSIDPLQTVFVIGQRADLPEVTRAAADTAPPAIAYAADSVENVPQPRQLQVNASFGEANLIIYRILDKATGDLILQIPPEQLLQIAQSVRDLLRADLPQPVLDIQS